MTMASSKKRKIFSLSLAHLLNDWYMNYLQTLLPFMVAAGLSVSKGAFLISAFTITSSLLQPVFGYLVDQKNQRWMVYVGTFWMAALLCLVGVLNNYWIMIITVSLAGLGTSAFHPQASAMITALSGGRRGFFQGLFISSGNIGWALTPLIVVPFTHTYGLKSTPWFVLPGVIVAMLLWFTAPRDVAKAKSAPPPLWPILRSVWPDLSKVVLVVACRSLTYFGLVSFLPLYLQQKNVSLLTGSRLMFAMLFAGALGGMVGGHLSDRFGRKAVIVFSLILAGPLFYLFLGTSGILSYVLLALAGACLLASFSVTIVIAQEIIAKNAAMAAGLMLGFGIGIGGLGVGLVGLVAEHVGLDYAIHLLIWLPILAGLCGLSLKGGKTVALPSVMPSKL
ncbi:MAG: MFS transporter [Deltaproteobacteria bacterium]|nr:MFS transporter [Deltaproteobacteria bacterium]